MDSILKTLIELAPQLETLLRSREGLWVIVGILILVCLRMAVYVVSMILEYQKSKDQPPAIPEMPTQQLPPKNASDESTLFGQEGRD